MMRKDAREEKKKKKVEELARTQRTTPADEESIYGGVTKKSKIPTANEEWDIDYKTFLETYKGREYQEDNV